MGIVKTQGFQLTIEVDRIIKTLKKLENEFSVKERQKMLSQSGKIVVKAIKSKVPVAGKDVKKYNTPKISGKLKAPKNEGKVEAVYTPGNLKRSIQVLKFRKSNSVFIGPKLARKNKQGTFSGRKVDGWYAKFVEFGVTFRNGKKIAGSRFMLKGWLASEKAVAADFEKRARQKIDEFAKKHRA